jgi:hypothetical protein
MKNANDFKIIRDLHPPHFNPPGGVPIPPGLWKVINALRFAYAHGRGEIGAPVLCTGIHTLPCCSEAYYHLSECVCSYRSICIEHGLRCNGTHD